MDYKKYTCGCGKPIRYITSDGKEACNRYGRCLTYEELQNKKIRLLKKWRERLAHEMDILTENKDQVDGIQKIEYMLAKVSKNVIEEFLTDLIGR